MSFYPRSQRSSSAVLLDVKLGVEDPLDAFPPEEPAAWLDLQNQPTTWSPPRVVATGPSIAPVSPAPPARLNAARAYRMRRLAISALAMARVYFRARVRTN
jgi:hypothetical protein